MTLKFLSVEYNSINCNIPGCLHGIYKNYMCKAHYEFYLSDERIRKISDEIVAVHDGNATWWQMLLSMRDNLLHHTFDIPQVRYEHFPLEHVYLLALRYFDKKDVVRCRQVFSDFNIPENENIAMMRRVVNSRNPEEASIGAIEQYLFQSNELISYWYILISIIGCLGAYLILKFCNPWTDIFFGLSYSGVVEFYECVFPYILFLIFMMLLGVKLARSYNYFANRAYDLGLFEMAADNIEVLNQIEYVKQRNQRVITYRLSLLGSMTGVLLLGIYEYFSLSSFNIGTLGIFVCSVFVVFPLMYIYSISILYFPVFESLKRKHFKINLYNPDHCGGLAEMHKFLFRTFVYNEGIVCVCFKMGIYFDKWWLYILIGLLVLNRVNHGGWSLVMYLSSVKDYIIAKKNEKLRLLLQNDEQSFERIEKLGSVSVSKTFNHIGQLIVVLVIPYIINHVDEWYLHLEVIMTKLFNYIKI